MKNSVSGGVVSGIRIKKKGINKNREWREIHKIIPVDRPIRLFHFTAFS